jgi:hypothetical protein
MVAQAVIEKIALPLLAMLSRDELMPDHLQAIIAFLRQPGMQTTVRNWKKHAQAVMPARSLVVEFHGGEQGIASFCVAELVLARRHAVDGDK